MDIQQSFDTLKDAVLRHPEYLSGDDSLATWEGALESAAMVLDRIADERQGLKEQARWEMAEEAFVDYDFGACVEDMDGWEAHELCGVPFYMERNVYLESPEGGDTTKVLFVVRWDEHGVMTVGVDGVSPVKVVVACHNASGGPELIQTVVMCTKEQCEEGRHYEMAIGSLKETGHEGPWVAFDENDGPDVLFKIFE